MNFRKLGFLVLVAVILVFSVSFVAAKTMRPNVGPPSEPENEKCMGCHTDPEPQIFDKDIPLFRYWCDRFAPGVWYYESYEDSIYRNWKRLPNYSGKRCVKVE